MYSPIIVWSFEVEYADKVRLKERSLVHRIRGILGEACVVKIVAALKEVTLPTLNPKP